MPDINFDCPSCGQNLDAPEDMAGQEITCPACGKAIEIPGGDPDAEQGLQEQLPENLKKGSTMRLEVPKNLVTPPPRQRIIKIKRLHD